ncbi:MAG TPA: MarR family transcriptional regulator [Acidimicrobiales bacterium]|jgi:DNA-binding MarR family transcriptional regulator|nr:MarR family transcriptional regulator [Acidimicrobiales bacterium]
MGQTADSIGVIEIELLTLVRQLDTLGRSSSLYVHVDRAGYLALRTLERLGPVRTNELAEALHLDASTVTRQVTTLAASGFVARRPDPADGRSSTLVLTTEGKRVMRTVERERRVLLQELFSDWAEDERRDLGRVLTKLNRSMGDRMATRRQQLGSPRTGRD